MKLYTYAILLIVSVQFNVIAQKSKVKLDGDDVLANKMKIASITENTQHDGIQVKYLIKDVNGEPRLYVSSEDNLMYFTDDKRSYSKQYKAASGMMSFASEKKLVAEFLANYFKILTPQGYIDTLKLPLIKKHSGGYYDQYSKKLYTIELRDRTSPISILDYNERSGEYESIYQDGYVIGKISFLRIESNTNDPYFDKTWFTITNTYGVKIAEFCRYFSCKGCTMPTYDIKNPNGLAAEGKALNYSKNSITDYVSTIQVDVGGKYVNKTTYPPTAIAYQIQNLYNLNKDGKFEKPYNGQSIKEAKGATKSNKTENKQKGGVSQQQNEQEKVDNKISNSKSPQSKSDEPTQLFTKTDSKLEAMKQSAVAKSDFETAAEIKAEINLRKKEKDELLEKQKQLNQKVKNEEFSEAAELQKEVKKLKDKIDKKNLLRKSIENAVKAQNYEKAEELKKELQDIL